MPSSAISTLRHLALTSLPRPGVRPFQLQVRGKDEEILFHVPKAPLTPLPRLSIGSYQGQEESLSAKAVLFSALQNSSRQGNGGPFSLARNREVGKYKQKRLLSHLQLSLRGISCPLSQFLYIVLTLKTQY